MIEIPFFVTFVRFVVNSLFQSLKCRTRHATPLH
jgi:hypothetical protein